MTFRPWKQRHLWGSVIEKTRYTIPCGDLVWQVDMFSSDNAGLTIAEIELSDINQRVELPDWVGAEVTGQLAFYNSSLAQRPFCSWSHHRTVN